MTSLTDILTAAKNVVTAINGLGQTYLNVQGALSYTNLSATTLIHTGAGRVCNVIVTTAGTTAGSVYDSTNTTSPSNKVYSIPNTVGVYTVNFPINYGIVIAPGSGQIVSISHS
jgi:hypothetical protein